MFINTYKGDVKNGKRHGMGEQVTKEGTYIKGNFFNRADAKK